MRAQSWGTCVRVRLIDYTDPTTTGSVSIFFRRKGDAASATSVRSPTGANVVEVGHLAPAWYDLEALVRTTKGSSTGRTSVEVRDSDIDESIVVHKNVQIVGRVFTTHVADGAFRPVSGVQVQLIDSLGLNPIRRLLRTAADGLLLGTSASRDVPLGNYRVDVSNIPAGTYVAAIRDGTTNGLLLRCQKHPAVSPSDPKIAVGKVG